MYCGGATFSEGSPPRCSNSVKAKFQVRCSASARLSENFHHIGYWTVHVVEPRSHPFEVSCLDCPVHFQFARKRCASWSGRNLYGAGDPSDNLDRPYLRDAYPPDSPFFRLPNGPALEAAPPGVSPFGEDAGIWRWTRRNCQGPSRSLV